MIQWDHIVTQQFETRHCIPHYIWRYVIFDLQNKYIPYLTLAGKLWVSVESIFDPFYNRTVL